MSAAELKPYELMQKAVNFFERQNIPYRVVGSMASMAYSEARFTNDIDFLVDLREPHISDFVVEFPEPDFYMSQEAARDAIRNQHQFNIIHFPSGLKLDIIQRKDTEFGRLDIASGVRLKNEGYYDAWFGSAENVILMKLKYYQEGGSEKHLRDIASMVLVQGTKIDKGYIELWSQKLGVEKEWQLVTNNIRDLAP